MRELELGRKSGGSSSGGGGGGAAAAGPPGPNQADARKTDDLDRLDRQVSQLQVCAVCLDRQGSPWGVFDLCFRV